MLPANGRCREKVDSLRRWLPNDMRADRGGYTPALCHSADAFHERSSTVIAVALTSQEPRAGFPSCLRARPSGDGALTALSSSF